MIWIKLLFIPASPAGSGRREHRVLPQRPVSADMLLLNTRQTFLVTLVVVTFALCML